MEVFEEWPEWATRVLITVAAIMAWRRWTAAYNDNNLVQRRVPEHKGRPPPRRAFWEDSNRLDDLHLEESEKEDLIEPSATEKDPKKTQGIPEAVNQKNEKAKAKSAKSRQTQLPAASQTRASEGQQSQPSFKSSSNTFPGLDAFWYWCDIEASLFRVYNAGRTDDVAVIPPYNPQSRRGKVSVFLHVTNQTSRTLVVNWINYKGREDERAKVRPGHSWTQSTWIDHPWVFRDADTDQVVLHYIPYRVIPTLDSHPTTSPDDPEVGMHKFVIRDGSSNDPFVCEVLDNVMPFPAKRHLRTPVEAFEWTLVYCRRLGYLGWPTLQKYLANIVEQPENTKYRQLRQGNPSFAQDVWNSPARGLLFALGFVENGAYLEVGTADPLPAVWVRALADGLKKIRVTASFEGNASGDQPLGADGYGAAGYNRVGGMDSRS